VSTLNTYAYFFVNDFECSPDDIGRILELEASKSWEKGDPIANTKYGRRKRSSWRLESERITDENSSASCIEGLLRILEIRKENLSLLPNKTELGLTCVITTDSVNFCISLDRQLLARVVELGLKIDFDIFAV
jgi:Domain of unknown function (DUF4279)